MARKKRELHSLDCPPWDKTGTPWGQEAETYRQGSNEPYEKCRDFVIMNYLHNGDVRPLADLLQTGSAPGPAVLRYIAAMLEAPSSEHHLGLPFNLLIKGKDGNRARERDIVWRDKLLSDHVEKKMGDKTGLYDAATLEVATEYNLSVDTVRKAYDKRNKKV